MADKAFRMIFCCQRVADIRYDHLVVLPELAVFLAGIAEIVRIVEGACRIHFWYFIN